MTDLLKKGLSNKGVLTDQDLVKALPKDNTKTDLLKKGLSNKGVLTDQDLVKALPKDKTWYFGKASDNGDCFYDTIAQLLNANKNNNNIHSIKSLRKLCHDYIQSLEDTQQANNWVKKAIEKDGSDDYEAHLATLRYTQEEMEEHKKNSFFTGYAIWGKPHVEGKILAEKLKIKLHIIEFHKDESGMETITPMHLLVTADSVKQKDESDIDYHDKTIIHLAVYRNHFVPVLPTSYLSKDSLEQDRDGKQEVTQFSKHSRNAQQNVNQSSFSSIAQSLDTQSVSSESDDDIELEEENEKEEEFKKAQQQQIESKEKMTTEQKTISSKVNTILENYGYTKKFDFFNYKNAPLYEDSDDKVSPDQIKALREVKKIIQTSNTPLDVVSPVEKEAIEKLKKTILASEKKRKTESNTQAIGDRPKRYKEESKNQDSKMEQQESPTYSQ
jgi:hypothetical protein